MEKTNALRPVIFGEVLFDRFPDGNQVLGGAPFNVAWHLQAFGLNPLFISSVGLDEDGRQVRQAMQQWGMDLSGLQTHSQYSTGAVDVQLSLDQIPTYRILPDRAWDYISYTKLPAIPEHCLIYHGSLALRQILSQTAWQWLRQGVKQGPRFVDINLRAPWWSPAHVTHLLKGAQWLKLNSEELSNITLAEHDMAQGMQYLLETHNLEWVIVTQGEQETLAMSAQGEQLRAQPERDITMVDTVGAGDAFSSVMILGLIKGWGMQQTLENAQRFATASTTLRGATTLNHDFYLPFIEHWEL